MEVRMYCRIISLVVTCMLPLLFLNHAPAQPPVLKLSLTKIAGGFTSPVGMASPRDGTGRIFVIEQGGKVRIIKNNTVLDRPFISISEKVDGLNIAYSEKGLLGIAFHPEYRTNRRFYLYYSAPYKGSGYDHKSILAEYRASESNPDEAEQGEKIILEILQPESNHNGGCIEFGKDGFFYIGLGDGGGAGDRHGDTGNSQNLNTLLGKILRIDVDNADPYSIPPDNPFVNHPGAKPEIWAYGLRNPWRFSFDRVTGRLFCGDVGQDQYEEINIIEKGKNYGWRIMEGNHCFNPPSGCNTTGLTPPVDEYSHKEGISICGGYMYRGMHYPSLHGYYLFGDWSGKMFYLRQQPDYSWLRGEIHVDGKNHNDIGAKINSMGEDESGDVYVITQHLFGPKSPTGSVFRIGW